MRLCCGNKSQRIMSYIGKNLYFIVLNCICVKCSTCGMIMDVTRVLGTIARCRDGNNIVCYFLKRSEARYCLSLF